MLLNIQIPKNSNKLKCTLIVLVFLPQFVFAQMFIPMAFWSGRTWTPQNLSPNLLAWYDASNLSSVRTGAAGVSQAASGDPVSEWRDLSGNNFHAAQSIAARQPIYSATGWTNSLPTINWNGVDNGLVITGMNLQKYSFAFVMRHNNTTSVRAIMTKRSGVGAGFFWFLFNTTSGSINWDQDGARYNTAFIPATATDYVYVLVRPLTGSARTQYVNGTLSGSTATNADHLNTETLILGNDFSSANRGVNAIISEVIVVNNDLSVSQRQILEGYLAWKWGTVSTLPAAHPYKATRP
jgi:hypothetical protein